MLPSLPMSSGLKRCWSTRRAVAESVLHWSGLGRVYEKVARPKGAIILMYHSVARDDVGPFVDPPNHLPARVFERQMLFLKRHRNVVPLSYLVDCLEAGEEPEAGTVCITFDDGYLDTLTVAAPILASCYLPSTLFLATGYIDTVEPQWADRMYVAFTHRQAHRLVLPELGIDADMQRHEQRIQAKQRLHAYLLGALHGDRGATLAEIERQLAPDCGAAPRLGMDWDDVRRLRDDYPLMEIGGHSRGHTDLPRHEGEVAKREVDGCGDDLRRELGVDAKLFAYPYGRWSAVVGSLVSCGGWRSALGASDAVRVGPNSNLFNLARIAAPVSMSRLSFQTSGAYPGSLILLGKRLA